MKSWGINKRPVKIVITGPESTGKSTLTRELACTFQASYIPEYARQYVERLRRPYTYRDVKKIARMQFREDRLFLKKAPALLFFDTYYIITKMWFLEKFNRCPGWFLKQMKKTEIDLFLLCSPDLPWQEDPVRENGGAARKRLFREYEKEILICGCPYALVKGIGPERTKSAEKIVRNFLTG